MVLRPGQAGNPSVDQAPRAVQRVPQPLWGYTRFDTAPWTGAGMACLPRLKERQLAVEEGNEGLTAAEPGYTLATSSP